ncbi:MAG: DUF4013 domain-containing protein [Methanomicrobiaceae archaeon]|nr:DUF4013 domain-containing protein [Methanomicrobiaceae archaeon]
MLILLIIFTGAADILLFIGSIEQFSFNGWLIWTALSIFLAIAFLIYGYLIRVCRDGTVVPGFKKPGNLFIDGIKSLIIYLCWIIPLLLFCLILSICFMPLTRFNIVGIALTLILVFIAVFLSIYLQFYCAMGIVRFSKTGKIREGLNYSALKKIIRTNGWIMYIGSMIILWVVYVIVYIAAIFLFILNFIVGIIIALILLPPLMVFCARYIGAVYEEGDRDNISQDYFFE